MMYVRTSESKVALALASAISFICWLRTAILALVMVAFGIRRVQDVQHRVLRRAVDGLIRGRGGQ